MSNGTQSPPWRGGGGCKKAKLKYNKGGESLPPLPHWINPKVAKWSPTTQHGKKMNKVVGILLGMGGGEVNGSFCQVHM